MPDLDFDTKAFKETQEYDAYLKNAHVARDTMLQEMEYITLMDWQNETTVRQAVKNVKLTKSPDARNSIMGALRLLIAADPKFKVPKERNPDNVMEHADALEEWCAKVWWEAGRIRKQPVHYDAALSMLMSGELYMPITRTKDLLNFSEGASPGARTRAEELSRRTPYLVDVWNARTCWPDLGPLGLDALYRESSTTWGKIKSQFGERADNLAKFNKNMTDYTVVTFCQHWDLTNQVFSIKGMTPPLVQEEHGLPFIPVEVQIGEGSMLFEKPEQQRQPFLYTLWKSGLWERQNLVLTVLYTLIFSIGSAPMLVYNRANSDKHLRVDMSSGLGIAELDAGESLQWMAKQVIDPSITQGLQTADQKAMESTIYSQTLGEPLGANAPFSMVALLHQAGRLPLVVPQRKTNWGIADTLRKTLKWMKVEAPGGSYYHQAMNELKVSDIPDFLELEATLDIALPQDKLQQAQIANLLSGGDRPLVTRNRAREEYLGIDQPDKEEEEILREQFFMMFAQEFYQMMQQKEQQAQANQGKEQGQGGPPQGGPPPNGNYPNQEAMAAAQPGEGTGGPAPYPPPPAAPNVAPGG